MEVQFFGKGKIRYGSCPLMKIVLPMGNMTKNVAFLRAQIPQIMRYFPRM